MHGMLGAMSWRQFCEWLAYAELEPFGEERADYRSAQIVAMLANVNRDPKSGQKPFTPEDFMPKFGPPEPPKATRLDGARFSQLTADMKAAMRATTRKVKAHG